MFYYYPDRRTILHNASHTLQRHWTLTAKIAISAVCYTGVLVTRQTVMPTCVRLLFAVVIIVVAYHYCLILCSSHLQSRLKKTFCRMNYSLVTAFSADVLIFQTRPSFCRPDYLSVTMSLCPSSFCHGRQGPKPSNAL